MCEKKKGMKINVRKKDNIYKKKGKNNEKKMEF